MKDDIKEILDNLSNESYYSNFITSQYGGPDYYYLLEKDEGKILLNYITNLQTIEQQYCAILSENAELENKITNLQEENKRLKQLYHKKDVYSLEYDKETLATMLCETQNRIDKANNKLQTMFDNGNEKTVLDDLLELDKILNRGDKNE